MGGFFSPGRFSAYKTPPKGASPCLPRRPLPTLARTRSHTSAIIVTTSSKKERLEGYLAVGDIDLEPEEVSAIDAAGALGQMRDERKAKMVHYSKWAFIGVMGVGAVWFNLKQW